MDSDQAMIGRLSIGIGCSSRACSDDVIHLIQTSVAEIPAGSILATLDRRAAMGEIVASVLGLRLVLFPASVLAKIEGTTSQSSAALSATGTANVAEASALASLGPSARLLVAKRNGRFCTCAVAVSTNRERP
jgi:cobalt-precorrin 5A hydrolase